MTDVEIDDSTELDGIIIDYAKDRRIVAIEIIDASKRISKDPAQLINLAIYREEMQV